MQLIYGERFADANKNLTSCVTSFVLVIVAVVIADSESSRSRGTCLDEDFPRGRMIGKIDETESFPIIASERANSISKAPVASRGLKSSC